MMGAALLPLEGKYYGTKIIVVDDDQTEVVLTVWRSGTAPSERELAPDFTREEWDKNIKVPGGWGGEPLPIREADIIDWSHYESEESFRLASDIVDAINRYPS